MQKNLIIPIAAFALSISGAGAFKPSLLRQAGLSEEQIAAFAVAHDLKAEGDREGARDVLADAGIDLETIEEMRTVIQREV